MAASRHSCRRSCSSPSAAARPACRASRRRCSPLRRTAVGRCAWPRAQGCASRQAGPAGRRASRAALTVELEILTFNKTKVLQIGTGERPSAGHLAVVRLWDGRLRGGAKVDFPELVRFTMGAGEVITGLEAAAASMSLDERAEVTLPPLGAYGASGHPAGMVPPDAAITVTMELLGFV
mmetsp:Transcript_143033/g.398544  ORF Transcript_143033/g.398544 Transcript_143033/m.398544 type:complete len:179 (+) Transcript_143033:180-716(+)